MRKYNVEVVCTTDDPIDSLEHHIKIRKSGFETKVLPTWRPDKAMAIDTPDIFLNYINTLGEVSNTDISKFSALVDALKKRHDFFFLYGFRLSDHGLEEFYATDYTFSEIELIFDKAFLFKQLSTEVLFKFKSAMLVIFGVLDLVKG